MQNMDPEGDELKQSIMLLARKGANITKMVGEEDEFLVDPYGW
jgi:hypothetical protein